MRMLRNKLCVAFMAIGLFAKSEGMWEVEKRESKDMSVEA